MEPIIDHIQITIKELGLAEAGVVLCFRNDLEESREPTVDERAGGGRC